MQGWKLTEGQILEFCVEEPEIWQIFNTIFSTKSKNQASYKFGLVRALMDNLYNVNANLELTYDQIFDTFARVYWNLVIKYNLRQTDNSHTQSAIEKILREIQQKYQIPSDCNYDKLPFEVQLESLSKVKSAGKRYVIGALYGDTKGLFYEFSLKQEYLKFNPSVYRFCQRYQQIILRLNNYEWAKFLAKNNPVPASFIDAIECISKRTNLEHYMKLLEEYTNYQCFYCQKDLSSASIHVDHFIPWSYIHSDNLWNLVLACSKCNLSKRNRIPKENYLELIIERNRKLSQVNELKNEYRIYSDTRLRELFQYAEINGFDRGWEA